MASVLIRINPDKHTQAATVNAVKVQAICASGPTLKGSFHEPKAVWFPKKVITFVSTSLCLVPAVMAEEKGLVPAVWSE